MIDDHPVHSNHYTKQSLIHETAEPGRAEDESNEALWSSPSPLCGNGSRQMSTIVVGASKHEIETRSTAAAAAAADALLMTLLSH
ncbi:hypothetical protein RB195_000589 [Necator americanus]|uniref:Uncharacterized protein n=1 Tax=Necator americanus TaxID=51031 RepID=A0ABR1DAF9_NECAM